MTPTGAGIILMVVGALLKFALENPYALTPDLNLHVVGVVLVVAGALVALVGMVGR